MIFLKMFVKHVIYAITLCSALISATTLTDAVNGGNVDLVKELANEVTANKVDEYGTLPLSIAIGRDDVNMADVLISAGARLDPPEVESPLMMACREDKLEMVKFLLSKGANIDEVYQNEDVLNYSATHRSPRVLRYLAKEKRRYLNIFRRSGMSFLSYVCMYLPDVAKFMIEECECDIELTDAGGYTPLMAAATCDQTGELVKLLIKKGADVRRSTLSGSTALHTAAMEANLKVMEMLLAEKADVNAKGNFQNTPLFLATHFLLSSGRSQPMLDTIKMLLDAGADPYALDANGIQYIDATITRILQEEEDVFLYVPLLEIFLEAGIKIKKLGEMMRPLGISLKSRETFERYFRRLVLDEDGEFQLEGDIGAALITLENRGYHSLWYVAKEYFQMERGVKVPFIEEYLLKEKLFDLYYDDRAELFKKTYFDVVPRDFLRFFWFQVLNPDIEGTLKKRVKAVGALLALGGITFSGKLEEFRISNENIRPFLTDLLLELHPRS